MKIQGRYFVIAFLCGFFCTLGWVNRGQIYEISDIILKFGFQDVLYYSGDVGELIYWYMPLLFFKLFFGTFLYRHYCSASYYYFSRCGNRIVWFLKECLFLYVYDFCYLVCLLAGGISCVWMFASYKINSLVIVSFIYYIILNSLFLFFSTLQINLLSIFFSSNIGFAIIEGLYVVEAAGFCLIGDIALKSQMDSRCVLIWLRSNIIAHLNLYVHSSCHEELNQKISSVFSFDLNESVMLFVGISAVMILVGCGIVHFYQFINLNEERG